MKKRILSGLLCALVLAQLALPAAALDTGALWNEEAYPAIALTAAERLNGLGLFRGVGALPDGRIDFDLDRTATRGEALAMLLRLMGKEEEAQQEWDGSSPSDDAGWAAPYIAYAYRRGISAGVSETLFGTGEPIGEREFLTLLLRGLGYAGVDWQDPYGLADQVGLYYRGGICRRGDLALTCYSALQCLPNGGDKRLLHEVTSNSSSAPGGVRVTAVSTDGLAALLVPTMYSGADYVTICVPSGSEAEYQTALFDQMEGLEDIDTIWTNYNGGGGTILATITYEETAYIKAYLDGRISYLTREDMEALDAARQIRAMLVSDGKSAYEQVLAFHDYLVNYNTYDESAPRAHFAVSALVDGRTVCEGYSKAFYLLCCLSGIDCVRILGAAGGGDHSWNRVWLDGAWYNVDVTWDDPTGGEPRLLHDYFLVGDDTLAKDHQWIAYPHWPAAPQDYPGQAAGQGWQAVSP